MIMGRQSGLGRGLGAIIPPKTVPNTPSDTEYRIPSTESDALGTRTAGLAPRDLALQDIPVDVIDTNPHQPREHFDHQGLEELVASIRTHGVMQPIVVTPKADGRYELIAGERRLRASRIAGRETIPAVVRTATELQKLELALIENIQRQDLNPIEEAKAYLRLQDEFHLTQDEVAHKVGKSRSQVANTLRLLQLPQLIQDALVQQKISASNARTLLALSTDEERLELFGAMLEGNLTVRQTEARIPHRRSRRVEVVDPNLVQTERELRDVLGTKVSIKRDPRGEGEIRIIFLNDEDLRSIVDRIRNTN